MQHRQAPARRRRHEAALGGCAVVKAHMKWARRALRYGGHLPVAILCKPSSVRTMAPKTSLV